MSPRYISNDELFHFVGRNDPTDHEANYQILLAVLNCGCVSHPPHTSDWGAHRITINWDKDIFSEELIVPTVTCYCDIPLKRFRSTRKSTECLAYHSLALSS